jgi:cobalamin biosynthesis Co2+ chelatase CbiK
VVPLKGNGKERGEMKKKIVSLLMMVLVETTIATGCGASEEMTEVTTEVTTETVDNAEADQKAADEVAALIDAIYVQERTDDTDMQCVEAKIAWDALTESQKELVYGVNATPEYFGRDTGDASKDDARNQDEIGENEILVVSFGTSYNDSRVADIKGIEDAIAEAYPDWSVRRAFTSQIIINHVQARDDEHIDNMEQALQRAVDNGVKNLVVQPTHLMQGTEYDELVNAVEKYSDKFETVVVAEPLLGEVGSDASVINEDKEKVAKAITNEAVSEAGYDSLESAKNDGVAFVFMGHGTSHTAKVSYSQMQTQMSELGYDNVFIGTVEGEPEETACENVIEAVAGAGYTKVVLRPLMVVAGDHANNDMAGDDEDSWKSMFLASGKFESVDTQISGLGSIDAIKQLYVEHTSAVMALEDTSSEATTETITSTNNNTSKNLPDATYSADFETDSSMFHVNEAYDGKGTLYIQNGEMTIHISLTSKNIVNLYLGLAEDAQKSGAQLIEPTIDTVIYSDGTTEEVYGFDVPVPYLNEEFDLALIGTKGKWYDHKVKVSNPVISEGEYFIDLKFEGGSGKASISSPASINVSDGEVTALVEWSSPNYDYMIVDGEKYYPINEDGNSVFLIPVKAFDEPIEVIGDTVAMSTPHEIEYTLTFYFDTIKKPQ